MNAKKATLTYKVPSGAIYKIQYRRVKESLFGATYYKMRVLEHPPCPHPLGVQAHLLAGDTICVAQGREPRTIERAKAVALHWMCGFEGYRTSGVFPNGTARFDVKEVTA